LKGDPEGSCLTINLEVIGSALRGEQCDMAPSDLAGGPYGNSLFGVGKGPMESVVGKGHIAARKRTQISDTRNADEFATDGPVSVTQESNK